MKKQLGAIILACVALVGCDMARSGGKNDEARSLLPVVEISESTPCVDTVNLGRVGQGQTLLYEFAFENRTAEPLSIVTCDTGCGCVTAEYGTKPWGVGAAEECRLEIHTDGRNGEWMHRVRWTLSSDAKYDIVFRMEVK